MTNNHPLPSHERAIYGFILFLLAHVLGVVYLIWAYIPDEWLALVYLTYWPHKYWAIIGPVFFVAACFFILLLYVFGNYVMVKSPESIANISDQYFKPVCLDGVHELAIPPIGDMLISDVCKDLYFIH